MGLIPGVLNMSILTTTFIFYGRPNFQSLPLVVFFDVAFVSTAWDSGHSFLVLELLWIHDCNSLLAFP